MRKIMIDGDKYKSPDELHSALKMMLDLPDYYGKNADALNDCLTEMNEHVDFMVLSLGCGETKQALVKCLHVIEDLGGNVTKVGNW